MYYTVRVEYKYSTLLTDYLPTIMYVGVGR